MSYDILGRNVRDDAAGGSGAISANRPLYFFILTFFDITNMTRKRQSNPGCLLRWLKGDELENRKD